MRHKNSGRQFGRNSSHRRAMLRSLTANLIAHERIETTDAKAKELRRVAERVITKARRLGEVAYTPKDELSLADRARRHAAQKEVAKFLQRFAVVTSTDEEQKVDLIEKVFVDLAKRYKSRAGGYTRIIKVGNRRGDNAPISIIELVEEGSGKKAPNVEASQDETKSAGSTKEKKDEPKPTEASQTEAEQAEAEQASDATEAEQAEAEPEETESTKAESSPSESKKEEPKKASKASSKGAAKKAAKSASEKSEDKEEA